MLDRARVPLVKGTFGGDIPDGQYTDTATGQCRLLVMVPPSPWWLRFCSNICYASHVTCMICMSDHRDDVNCCVCVCVNC